MNQWGTRIPLRTFVASNLCKMPNIGIFLLVVLLLGACGEANTPANQTTPTVQSSRIARNSPTTQSTPSPTPTYVAQPPVLAGDLRDFIHHYGQPTSSNPSAGAYHFSVYSDEDLTVLIEQNHVRLILLSAPSGTSWTEAQAKQKCDGFIPQDRFFTNFYTVPDGSQLTLVWVFKSDTVAKNLGGSGIFHEAFFATNKVFTDCQLALEED